MRILFINNGLAGGGAEKLINDLLPYFNKEDECDLLILSDKEEKYLSGLIKNKVRVDIVPASYNNHLKRIRYIKNFIKKGNYDIIHANTFPTIYYCAIIKKLWKIKQPKFIMTEHNTDNRRRHYRVLKPVEKYIYSAYDKVISISSATQGELLKWIKPKDPGKYCVIENGVPLETFLNASPAENPLVNETTLKTIPNERVFLCMIGSFTEQKNHRFMIDVMESLPDKYFLILLGEGPLRKEIELYTEEKKISNRVCFLGFRKDVPQIIKACDIIVIPSKWEGFGLVAVEAMACGKPVVCSNVPGLADVVGSAGIVTDLVLKSFIDSIISLQKEDLYRDYCQKSLERAALYDITTMYKSYKTVYLQVLGNLEHI